MTNLSHVYLTAHGSFTTGPWTGENAQFGLRLPFVPTISAPDKGAIYTPASNGEIVADTGTTAGTNGTLARTWTARIGPVGSDENVDANMQVDMAEDVRTFVNAIKAYTSSAFRWTHVKIAGVDTLGDIPRNSAVYTFTTPVVGTGTTAQPPQVALALSLRANLVGRRGRGRIYVPALAGAILTSDGTLATSPGTTMRTAFKQLVDDLQNLPGTPDYIPIVSVMSADSADAVRPLHIRTGDRLDTIQSRRRQVAETYTTLAL